MQAARGWFQGTATDRATFHRRASHRNRKPGGEMRTQLLSGQRRSRPGDRSRGGGGVQMRAVVLLGAGLLAVSRPATAQSAMGEMPASTVTLVDSARVAAAFARGMPLLETGA